MTTTSDIRAMGAEAQAVDKHWRKLIKKALPPGIRARITASINDYEMDRIARLAYAANKPARREGRRNMI